MSYTSTSTFKCQTQYASWRRQLRSMRHDITSISISPDGLKVAAGGYKGEIQIWHIPDDSGFVLREPTAAGVGLAYRVAFSPDGQYLAANIDKTFLLWMTKTGQLVTELTHTDTLTSMAFSPDGVHIAFGTKEFIYIWNINTNKQDTVLEGNIGYVWNLCYFTDGFHLASTDSEPGTIRIWSLDQLAKLQGTWKVSSGCQITCCALSPDGKTLASGGSDKQVILWDVETGSPLKIPYQGHTQRVTSVAFSPDGRHVASAAGEVHICEARSGSFIAKLDDCCGDVAYAPEWRYIVTVDAQDPKSLRILELTIASLPQLPEQEPSWRSASASNGGCESSNRLLKA